MLGFTLWETGSRCSIGLRAVCAALCLLLTACGGGSGGDSGDADRQLISSVSFIDSDIEYCVKDAAAEQGWTFVDQVIRLQCQVRSGGKLADLAQFPQLQELAVLAQWGLTPPVPMDLDLGRLEQLRTFHGEWLGFNTLDLSSHPSLQSVELWYSDASAIVSAGNPVLEELMVINSSVDSVDVGAADSALTLLALQDSNTTSYSLYPLPNLESLYITDHSLSAIDLSQFPQLTYLSLSQDGLASLDLALAPHLQALHLFRFTVLTPDLSVLSQLDTLGLTGMPWVNADYSSNLALEKLHFRDVTGPVLDLTTFPDLGELLLQDSTFAGWDISQNHLLEKLFVLSSSVSGFALADLNHLVALEELNLMGIDLSSLNLSFFPNLESVDLNDDTFTSVDMSLNSLLKEVWLSGAQLANINFPTTATLKEVSISDSMLSSVDLTGLDGLEELRIGAGNLASLDLSANSGLINVSVNDNPLTTLVLPSSTTLEYVSVYTGMLNSVDVSSLPNLISLGLSEQQLTSMDVSANTLLEWLDLDDNQLTTIDLDNNSALRFVGLRNNPLAPATQSYLDALNAAADSVFIDY